MFEVFKSPKTGKFHFRLKAKNGEIILSGQAYKDKAGCLNGIESVKKNAQVEDRFEVKEASNGKKYFTLKSTNGQIVGTSQQYKSDSGLKNGLASVAKNAAAGEVKEVES
ncbi:MAG: YegP family protein [Verrucomicrobiota bacterium]